MGASYSTQFLRAAGDHMLGCVAGFDERPTSLLHAIKRSFSGNAADNCALRLSFLALIAVAKCELRWDARGFLVYEASPSDGLEAKAVELARGHLPVSEVWRLELEVGERIKECHAQMIDAHESAPTAEGVTTGGGARADASDVDAEEAERAADEQAADERRLRTATGGGRAFPALAWLVREVAQRACEDVLIRADAGRWLADPEALLSNWIRDAKISEELGEDEDGLKRVHPPEDEKDESERLSVLSRLAAHQHARMRARGAARQAKLVAHEALLVARRRHESLRRIVERRMEDEAGRSSLGGAGESAAFPTGANAAARVVEAEKPSASVAEPRTPGAVEAGIDKGLAWLTSAMESAPDAGPEDTQESARARNRKKEKTPGRILCAIAEVRLGEGEPGDASGVDVVLRPMPRGQDPDDDTAAQSLAVALRPALEDAYGRRSAAYVRGRAAANELGRAIVAAAVRRMYDGSAMRLNEPAGTQEARSHVNSPAVAPGDPASSDRFRWVALAEKVPLSEEVALAEKVPLWEEVAPAKNVILSEDDAFHQAFKRGFRHAIEFNTVLDDGAKLHLLFLGGASELLSLLYSIEKTCFRLEHDTSFSLFGSNKKVPTPYACRVGNLPREEIPTRIKRPTHEGPTWDDPFNKFMSSVNELITIGINDLIKLMTKDISNEDKKYFLPEEKATVEKINDILKGQVYPAPDIPGAGNSGKSGASGNAPGGNAPGGNAPGGNAMGPGSSPVVAPGDPAPANDPPGSPGVPHEPHDQTFGEKFKGMFKKPMLALSFKG